MGEFETHDSVGIDLPPVEMGGGSVNEPEEAKRFVSESAPMPTPPAAPAARESEWQEHRHEEHRPERSERAERPEREERADRTPALDGEALAAEGKHWTEELLKAMGFEAKVEATAEQDRVDVVAEVAADDDLLTGPKGEVRQALQHLLNRMINRGEGSRYHLQLEINEFWKRREDELREIAKRLADEALRTGGEVVTEYLNAQERRIIHVTLREDNRVRTYALGDGMIKRLAVAPAEVGVESREGQ
jgi:spoIIIJ-associated protein